MVDRGDALRSTWLVLDALAAADCGDRAECDLAPFVALVDDAATSWAYGRVPLTPLPGEINAGAPK